MKQIVIRTILLKKNQTAHSCRQIGQYTQRFNLSNSSARVCCLYPSNLPLNVGDSCVARYWEDDKFYPAVIEAIAGNGRTAVVTFVEYGTQEEVGVEDIQLLQQPGWAYQVPTSVYGVPNMSTSLPDPASFHGAPTYVPPMEFTRGGSYYNNGGRRQENNDRRRPYYQHLNQRPP